MEIKRVEESGKVILRLYGRLDATSSQGLQDILIPEFTGTKHIELDMGALDYISSAGLRVLLLGAKTAKEKGTSMTVTNVLEAVMEVFEITGFSAILTIV